MPHVHTRGAAKVAAVDGAELHCSICDTWKPARFFGTKEHNSAKPRYHNFCLTCNTLRNSLREKVGGKQIFPSYQQVREALGKGLTFAGVLNQARHGHTQPVKPLSTAAREELRERREESEGRPSMCYLVGMEGDNSAVKIGHSTNVYRRMAQYQSGNPRKLMVLGLLPGGEQKERELHRKFMSYHSDEYVGEWFARVPEIEQEFGI